MTTTIEAPAHQTELTPVKYSITDAAIAILREDYLQLTISGVEDKAGFDVVHKARMVVRKKRGEVEKTRKALKFEVLRYGRTVDGEAKRITALLEPIESHLLAEETKVTDEQNRIKREAEEARQAALEDRLNELTDVGCMLSPLVVEKMTDEEFTERLKAETETHEKSLAAERIEEEERERQRIEEEERRKAEEERLRVDRAKLEADRETQRLADEERSREIEERERQQREEQAKLDAQRAKLKAEEKSRLRQIELEQEKKEAAELARQEERKKIDREHVEQINLAKAEAKEAARLEALRPDKEKLLAVADAVEGISVPEESELSDNFEFTRISIRIILDDAVQDIRATIDQM